MIRSARSDLFGVGAAKLADRLRQHHAVLAHDEVHVLAALQAAREVDDAVLDQPNGWLRAGRKPLRDSGERAKAASARILAGRIRHSSANR
jgi:hypothetical protein